jgi:hypothetical protein
MTPGDPALELVGCALGDQTTAVEDGDSVGEPASGLRSVEKICTAVVFPAPLGPSSEKVVPSGTSRSMPSTTTFSPNDLRRPMVCTADRRVLMVTPRPSR